VVAPITTIIEPVVAPVVSIIEPVVAPAQPVTIPVGELWLRRRSTSESTLPAGRVSIVQSVVAPVATSIEPVTSIIEPVVAPVTTIVEPVVEPAQPVKIPVGEPWLRRRSTSESTLPAGPVNDSDLVADPRPLNSQPASLSGALVQLDGSQQRLESVQAVLEPENLMPKLLNGGATAGSGLFEVTAPTSSGKVAVAPLFERAVVARAAPLGPLPGAIGSGGLIGSWPPTPNGSPPGAGQADPPSPQQLVTALALTIIAALSATLPLPLPALPAPLGNGSSPASIATPAGNGAAGSTGVNSSRSDIRDAALPLLLALSMATWRALSRQSSRIPTGITLTDPVPPG
jgi:hypothetical protein